MDSTAFAEEKRESGNKLFTNELPQNQFIYCRSGMHRASVQSNKEHSSRQNIDSPPTLITHINQSTTGTIKETEKSPTTLTNKPLALINEPQIQMNRIT